MKVPKTRIIVRAGPSLGLALVLFSGISCRDEITHPSEPPSVTTSPAVAAAVAVPSFRQISAFERHTCALTPDNLAYCWGRNFSGQLGDGTRTTRLLPVAVAGGLRFRQISAGNSHTCGVTTSDLAYCWGNNPFGQLGDGTTTRRLTPTRVMGGLTFREIVTGSKHTCAVTLTNVVYCWGYGSAGQLGSGTFVRTQLSPAPVVGTTRFSQLTAGSQHSCGLSTGARVFCWGLNNFGQLGDGTNTNRARPAPIRSDLVFSRVKAARLHTCAVTLDSKGYCWGDNSFHKLGVDGTGTADTRVPLAVMGGLRFRQIDGGTKHSCGVTPGNLVKCWGWSAMGQLGNGSQGNSLGPTRTAIDLQVRQLATGFDHTCAVTTDDRAYCWGSNEEGELGVGSTLLHTIATPVGGRPADSPFVVVRFRSEQNGSVNPAVDTVAVGTKMTWIWSGGASHNVTSTGSPTFPNSDVRISGTGKQYAVTFNSRGTYTYHCSLHEGMTGRILVR